MARLAKRRFEQKMASAPQNMCAVDFEAEQFKQKYDANQNI